MMLPFHAVKTENRLEPSLTLYPQYSPISFLGIILTENFGRTVLICTAILVPYFSFPKNGIS